MSIQVPSKHDPNQNFPPLGVLEHIICSTIGGAIAAFFGTELPNRLHIIFSCSVCNMCAVIFSVLCNPIGCREDKTPVSDDTWPSREYSPFSWYFGKYSDAFIKIGRYEGLPRLWRGLQASLVMTLPSTAIYFTLYEQIKYNVDVGYLTPLVAGSTARIIAVTFTSPLDMFRTNMQSHSRQVGAIELLMRMIQERRISQLWVGLKPTLYRDVPFSAIYWMGYEYLKMYAINNYKLKDGFTLNFACGAIAGSVAALATVPFDVVKTRMQMNVDKPGFRSTATVLQTMKQIASTEGYRGLMRGAIPRVAKVGPSCAVFISSYAYMKQFFLRRRHNENTDTAGMDA